jgi:hypothetical protein
MRELIDAHCRLIDLLDLPEKRVRFSCRNEAPFGALEEAEA